MRACFSNRKNIGEWSSRTSENCGSSGNPLDYTTQLRALEKAQAEKPNDPAMRFLAGFHYAYLGYPKEAINQLDKGLKIVPRDEMAKQLRDEMQAKLPKPAEATTPEAPATP